MTLRFHRLAQWPILATVAIGMLFYFNFTAEDAYITYRYAENLVNIGSMVFNEGEPIDAMTSPLHAVLSAVLFLATGRTVLVNKLLALVLLLVSGLLVWARVRDRPQWQPLALVLTVMPPSILLWTLGGLETPILLFLVTVATCVAERAPTFGLNLLFRTFLLAALAFLTRHDSILFFLPLSLHATLRARSARHVGIAVAGAAILPLAWFAVSVPYYGDPLPTSFYVKTPSGNLVDLVSNARYVASYLLYVGLIPVWVLALALAGSVPKAFRILRDHLQRLWWLYLGLSLELLYGLTIATHHMMFSFRFFVPYLPSAAVVAVDLVRRASEAGEADWFSGRRVIALNGFLVGLALFQGYQLAYTYHRSLNGISAIGEYRAIGVRDYVQFMRILEQEARDIEAHWEEAKGGTDRRPRILTYAAGIVPYTFRDAYIYEKLVSYRHCHRRIRQGLYADYLHILAPRLGSVAQQLPEPEGQYSLVSSYEMTFDGSPQQLLVYYNPTPEEHNLAARIYDPCQRSEQAH